MIFGFSRRKKHNRQIVEKLYAELTAAGRAEVFFAECGVPDTVMGRFEMIAAHMIVFLRRAMRGGRETEELAQEVVDAFFQDLDHSLREIGIGDQGVPKRMKKLARMFYGRYEAYSPALDAGDREALAAALARNIAPGREEEFLANGKALVLAGHLIAVERALAETPTGELGTGRLDLPTPASTEDIPESEGKEAS